RARAGARSTRPDPPAAACDNPRRDDAARRGAHPRPAPPPLRAPAPPGAAPPRPPAGRAPAPAAKSRPVSTTRLSTHRKVERGPGIALPFRLLMIVACASLGLAVLPLTTRGFAGVP